MSDDSLSLPWPATLESMTPLERELAEQRLFNEQLRLLGSAVHVAALGIAILTPAVEVAGPRIAFVNEGFCLLYGRPREEIIGATPAAFSIVERNRAIFDAMMRHLFEGNPFEAEATASRTNGGEFEIAIHIIPVNDGEQLTHWVAFVRDITTEKDQVHKLRHQALHDALTGLPNRTMLFDRLETGIAQGAEKGTTLALLLMDLDRFKEVNDTFGHQFGDLLLQQVAFRLRNQMREGDTVARLGGDEFAIVFDDAPDPTWVARRSRSILNALEQPFVVSGQVLEVGASIGIALFPEHGTDARTLLRRADVAMYAAKQAQIGYTFHRDEHDARSPDQLALVVELRGAVERNELELHYQPKIHLRSGLMTRAEVLLRWRHPQRGLLQPSAFIPVAERTGIIRAMTDWLIDRALEQVSVWHEGGAPIHVALNISAKSLLDQSLPSKVAAALEKWSVDPRFLKIEITESSIMADPAHALAVMSMLQSMGVRLSIDDFGTGYSSLTHLRELPVDEIKIDKAFVSGMASNDADASIVRTVIDLSHNLGKQVCAEGVEDEPTWKLLKEMGCDLAQGYYVSPPKTATELYAWLVESSWGLSFQRKA